MVFNGLHRTVFAICLTALIFATIVGVLCLIHRRERRRAHQAQTPTHVLPPRPAPYGIDLPDLSTSAEVRGSDETLVAPAVSAR